MNTTVNELSFTQLWIEPNALHPTKHNTEPNTSSTDRWKEHKRTLYSTIWYVSIWHRCPCKDRTGRTQMTYRQGWCCMPSTKMGGVCKINLPETELNPESNNKVNWRVTKAVNVTFLSTLPPYFVTKFRLQMRSTVDPHFVTIGTHLVAWWQNALRVTKSVLTAHYGQVDNRNTPF